MTIRKLGQVRLWQQNKGVVEPWNLFQANRNPETRWRAIAKLLGGESEMAHRLLKSPRPAGTTGLPIKVLEFIRFGDVMSAHDSLRYNPNLPFLDSLDPQEQQKEERKYKKMVATFRMVIPGFVCEELKSADSGVSLYAIPHQEKKPLFWDPERGLTIHLICQGESNHQWIIFEKLRRLGVPQREAETVLGTNVFREVWLQGNYESLHNLLGIRHFLHQQTSELVAEMYHLVQIRQPSFTRVKDPALFVHY
jgi:hypothetical protein